MLMGKSTAHLIKKKKKKLRNVQFKLLLFLLYIESEFPLVSM